MKSFRMLKIQKKTLSTRDSAFVSILGGKSGRTNIEILTKDFEKSISVFITQTEMLCEQTLKDANLTKDDIEEVLLVGGATRNTCNTKKCRENF